MLNIKSSVAVLTTSLILSACGSDNHQSKENNSTSPATFTTEFKSDLTLQKDSDPVIQIAGRTSNQDDNINAYSVTHHFEKSKSSIIFSYNLDKNDVSKTLYVKYDPILKEILGASIKSSPTKIGELQVGSMQYACSEFFYDACKNIQINFDDKTGYSELTFHNAKLSTSNLTDSTNTIKSFITLNGKLAGSLSNLPQTFEDIRKTSVSNLLINQQKNMPLAVIYDPILKQISFDTYTENNFDTGLKLNQFITTLNDKFPPSTILRTETLSGLSGACISKISDIYASPSSITVTENSNDITLTFDQTTYKHTNDALLTPNLPLLDTCPSTYRELNGFVKVNKPHTKLQISPIKKEDFGYSDFQVPAQYFDVANHNLQKFGNDFIDVEIKNKQIERVSFHEYDLRAAPNSNVLTVFRYTFTCDAKKSCKGISYDDKKTSITFKNTNLFYEENQFNTINQSITLNGVFDFAGR